MERTCKKCGETKPIDEFVKNKRLLSGHDFTCKKCSNKQKLNNFVEKYRNDQIFREHRLELSNNYKRNHPDRESYLAKKREYMRNHPGDMLMKKEYRKLYRENHKEQHNISTRNDARQARTNLSDSYIIAVIRQFTGHSAKTIRKYPEYIELQRKKIYHIREANQLLKNVQNEKSTNS